MVASTHELEWELDESESLAHSAARFTLRIHFSHWGFVPSDKFIEDWFRQSARGRVGSTAEFRKRFCEANHYQVQFAPNKWGPVVEVWGHAIPYWMENGKPRLIRILSRDWLLKQVGRSVRRPAFCVPKP
jgi:hypothetical protein